MYIEVKISLWKRIQIPKELEAEFKTKVLNKEITESTKAILYLNNYSEMIHERLLDAVEHITPENNQGEATFQVFDNKDNLVFSNDIIQESETFDNDGKKKATN